MSDNVFNYYRDHIAGKLRPRSPTENESAAMNDLANRMEGLRPIDDAISVTDEQVQYHVYETGKEFFGKENLRDWFKALYQILLGQDSGPRFGAFSVLYGIDETINLLRSRTIW